jgi:SsrA-binding protein
VSQYEPRRIEASRFDFFGIWFPQNLDVKLCASELWRVQLRLECSRLVLYARGVAKKEKNAKKAGNAGKKKDDDKNERVIADNRKARHNYTVLDSLECGIVLVGSEVKSIRNGGLSLDEAYGRVEQDEIWLFGLNIAEYTYSHALNHEPKRKRKLLMHRREMRKFAGQAFEKGLTLVPLKMYFKEGRAKVLLGICRGKQKHDKRESIKERDTKREISRAMRRSK